MNNLDALLQTAYQHHLTGRFPEAIEDYKAALRLDPDNATTHHDLRLAYSQTNQLQLALEEVENAAHLSPDNNGICLDRALLYDRLKIKGIQEIWEMVSCIAEDMVNARPEDIVNAQLLLGSLAEQQRNYAQALIHFENALRQKPDAVTVRGHVGKALLHLGRDVEARQALPLLWNVPWNRMRITEEPGSFCQRLKCVGGIGVLPGKPFNRLSSATLFCGRDLRQLRRWL